MSSILRLVLFSVCQSWHLFNLGLNISETSETGTYLEKWTCRCYTREHRNALFYFSRSTESSTSWFSPHTTIFPILSFTADKALLTNINLEKKKNFYWLVTAPTGTTIYKVKWESCSKGLCLALQYWPCNTKHTQTRYLLLFVLIGSTQKQWLQSKKTVLHLFHSSTTYFHRSSKSL